MSDLAMANDLHEVLKKLIPNLPEHLISLKLELDARELPTVECTFHPELPPKNGWETVTQRFNLVPVEA